MFYLYVLTFMFIRMEIVDKDFKVAYFSGFQYANKIVSYFFHVIFLETYKSYKLYPVFNICKKQFVDFATNNLKVFWKKKIRKTEKNLLQTLCIRIHER